MHGLRALLLLLAGGPVAAAGDWPQWLGPTRDNATAETIAPWAGPPKVAWRAKVGAGFSVPVVAGGKAFVHARVKGKDAEELIAFDAAAGKELWRTSYPRAPYTSVFNTGPQATPAVAGGRVYTHGITGILACFDAGTGKLVWQVDARKKFRGVAPRFGVTCSPLVVGSRVVVAVGGRDGASVVGFDAATGEEKWRALDEPANTSSPVLFAPPGLPAGKLPDAVFMTTLRVVGLNPLDGSLSWEYPLPFQPGGTSPTPLVAGDLVVTTTTQNGATAIRPADKAEAEPVWRAAGVRGYFSTGVAKPDLLFAVTNILEPTPRADLTCLDLKTGKERWKQEGLGYFHFGVVRTGDGKLLMLDDAGTLRLAAVDAGGYKELCKAKVCDGTMVAPAVAGGRVYVRDDDEVVCLDLGQ